MLQDILIELKNKKNYVTNLILKYQILNKNDNINKNKEIIIINSFGNLSNFLNYAKSVFIGKSTIKKFKRCWRSKSN